MSKVNVNSLVEPACRRSVKPLEMSKVNVNSLQEIS